MDNNAQTQNDVIDQEESGDHRYFMWIGGILLVTAAILSAMSLMFEGGSPSRVLASFSLS